MKEPYSIFVGQSLCIPASSTSSGTTTTTTTTSKAGFTIERTGDTLVIKVTNLAKKSVFVVKAQKTRRGNHAWIKVGRVKTSKAGVGGATLKLPKTLRTADVLTVCLKNSVTDTIVCQTVR